jgi:hypothetical protein
MIRIATVFVLVTGCRSGDGSTERPASRAAERPPAPVAVPLPAAPPVHPPVQSEGSASQPSPLEAFNDFSGILEIELNEPTTAIGGRLVNQKASPEARIKSLHLKFTVFERDKKSFRELTETELALVVIAEPTVKLRSLGKVAVTHTAPNGKHFAVRDLILAIEKTESDTRQNSKWFDGVDVHHRFFEGIERADDGVWDIRWGS